VVDIVKFILVCFEICMPFYLRLWYVRCMHKTEVFMVKALYEFMPITAAARSKACTVFARSNAGIVGSNPIQGMDVCVR
jgi:hypothetical protein